MMRTRVIYLILASVIAGLAGCYLVTSISTRAAAAVEGGCPSGQQTSKPYFDGKGVMIPGDKCIPATKTPGTVEYAYSYEALCVPNIPDYCAPMVCDEAEAPARLFAVIRTTLATGESQYMGAGCYSTKNDPPKVTPSDVLTKLKTREIPAAAIAVQPPGGRTLVNFKTIVSGDAKPYREDVTIFGRTVDLWIKPITWTWDFGDGSDPLARENAGVPWTTGVAMSNITEDIYTFHEYTDPSAFDIGLTVTWTADYKVEGDPDPVQAVPGSVDITSPSVPIEALEARPELAVPPA